MGEKATAILAAWQAGAIRRDTMTDLLWRSEVLPEGRSREEEEKLIGQEGKLAAAKPKVSGVNRQK